MTEQNTNYKFTTDWFHWAPDVWSQIAEQLPMRKKFLEIGSYEGRSTVWTVENMMEDGGEIVCIDTWKGGEEHISQGRDMGEAEANFDHNMLMCLEKFPKRNIFKLKMPSYEALGNFAMRVQDKTQRQYDFIYIDGSHQASDVLTDACMSWPLLKPGGVMVFDDYGWGEPIPPTHKPKMAIDAFASIYQEKLHVVHKSYQFVIQKTKN